MGIKNVIILLLDKGLAHDFSTVYDYAKQVVGFIRPGLSFEDVNSLKILFEDFHHPKITLLQESWIPKFEERMEYNFLLIRFLELQTITASQPNKKKLERRIFELRTKFDPIHYPWGPGAFKRFIDETVKSYLYPRHSRETFRALTIVFNKIYSEKNPDNHYLARINYLLAIVKLLEDQKKSFFSDTNVQLYLCVVLKILTRENSDYVYFFKKNYQNQLSSRKAVNSIERMLEYANQFLTEQMKPGKKFQLLATWYQGVVTAARSQNNPIHPHAFLMNQLSTGPSEIYHQFFEGMRKALGLLEENEWSEWLDYLKEINALIAKIAQENIPAIGESPAPVEQKLEHQSEPKTITPTEDIARNDDTSNDRTRVKNVPISDIIQSILTEQNEGDPGDSKSVPVQLPCAPVVTSTQEKDLIPEGFSVFFCQASSDPKAEKSLESKRPEEPAAKIISLDEEEPGRAEPLPSVDVNGINSLPKIKNDNSGNTATIHISAKEPATISYEGLHKISIFSAGSTKISITLSENTQFSVVFD